MAHQQESFLPFSSRQSLSCFLSHVAKGSTPKPCGPNLLCQSRVVLSIMAAAPGFKSQRQSSSAAPFPAPPTVSYTCQHSLFFQLYWAAIVSLGRCGHMAWSQSSPSSHAGAGIRGSCFPVTSWVEITPPLPGTKPGHSYLTHPSIKPVRGCRYVKDHARG